MGAVKASLDDIASRLPALADRLPGQEPEVATPRRQSALRPPKRGATAEPKPPLEGLDPAVVQAARTAGVPEDHLKEMAATVGANRPKLSERSRDVRPPVLPKRDPNLDETDLEDEDEPEPATSGSDQLAVAIAKLTSIAADAKNRNKADTLESILDGSGSADASSTSGTCRKNVAIMRALRAALQDKPKELADGILARVAEDYGWRRALPGGDRIPVTARAWVHGQVCVDTWGHHRQPAGAETGRGFGKVPCGASCRRAAVSRSRQLDASRANASRRTGSDGKLFGASTSDGLRTSLYQALRQPGCGRVGEPSQGHRRLPGAAPKTWKEEFELDNSSRGRGRRRREAEAPRRERKGKGKGKGLRREERESVNGRSGRFGPSSSGPPLIGPQSSSAGNRAVRVPTAGASTVKASVLWLGEATPFAKFFRGCVSKAPLQDAPATASAFPMPVPYPQLYKRRSGGRASWESPSTLSGEQRGVARRLEVLRHPAVDFGDMGRSAARVETLEQALDRLSEIAARFGALRDSYGKTSASSDGCRPGSSLPGSSWSERP